jgi:hypothetical protein
MSARYASKPSNNAVDRKLKLVNQKRLYSLSRKMFKLKQCQKSARQEMLISANTPSALG